jgi:beta-phosphoglucomutase
VIKGLAFDLDGTLISSTTANFLAYREALEQNGHALEWEQYKQYLGYDSTFFLKKIFPQIPDAEIPYVQNIKAECYPKYLSEIRLNASLISLIDNNRKNFSIALVTTAKKENVRTILDHFEIRSLFDLVITGNDVKLLKPHPDAYLLASKRMNLLGSQMIAFEDSVPGILSANEAGLSVIEVNFEDH